MAKATSKAPAKTKKPAKAKKAAPGKPAVSPEALIVKACEQALDKLGVLNIEHELQSEINWCLGSYQNDHNPVGLYQMAERSLIVFRNEQSRKAKGVTSKFVADLENALKGR